MKIKDKLLVLILTLALVPVVAIGLVFHFTTISTLGEQIEKTHYDKVASVDTLIFVVVSDMINIAFTSGPKIANLIERQDYQGLKEKLNLVDEMPEKTGRGIGYHIVIATDKKGNVLARSNMALINGVKTKMKVAQTGHIIGDWNASQGFREGFKKAKQGQIDARKIIYNQEFIKREGYCHFIERYGIREIMGLTAQAPILNQEKEQVGILFIITILNNNHSAIGAINAVTGTEFTAISPKGEIIASFFVNPPIPTPEIIKKARQGTIEMAQGIRKTTGKESIIYTKERVYLKPCPGKVIFRKGIGICYYDGKFIPHKNLEERPYRFHFIAEVDPDYEYVAIRGIAYDLTYFDELMTTQTRHFIIVLLIAFLIITILSLIAANKGVYPILKFTKKIQEIEKGNLKQKINIKTGDEIETLARTFNGMLEKINQSYNEIQEQKEILEIKVNARTKELKDLSMGLEENIKERTKELQEKLDELERFQKITIGREKKMIELKKEITDLKEKLEKK